jgi:hypothetical protein
MTKTLVVLASVLIATSTHADPLADFYRQRGPAWHPQTLEEFCQVALLALASPQANEQLRIAIREMARNGGCYGAPQAPAQAQPSFDEQARIAVCRTVPDLLSQPNLTTQQKLSVMQIAKNNGCIR